MAMGTSKQREKQEDIWIAHTELASAPAHPFYEKLNELLTGDKFDEFVEERCAKFYAAKYGRPSVNLSLILRVLLGAGTPREVEEPAGTIDFVTLPNWPNIWRSY